MEDELQITLTNDYAFKRLLGSEENKPLLQDFLECILDLTPQQVLDLEFMDKELTKEEFSDKTGILDVKLKLTNGTVIDIEIQALWNASFVKRTLFYWAKMYTADFKAGKSYDKLHRCIAINIIADGFRLNDAIHSEYLLQEKTAHTVLTDVLEIHFLDLHAAKRAKEEGKGAGKRGQLINWLRFIGAANKKERAMIATKSPVLQMLNEKIDVLTLSPTERKLYESRMKLKSDIATISETQFSAGVERGKSLGLAEGEARGKSLGLAEGEARGSRQKALETARNLLVIGLSIENIAKATGLTVQEVETLNQ
ncbi:Rpn family recombination-promoting nuclease/putative transposase [Treponema sp.]|uniref:Rpn family recombination-promoting nuclease/putative transposase n=2 Tax=Treponema sp. TaxID=166 RepID=UPI003FA1E7E2